MSCGENVDPRARRAIEINSCPFCGDSIFDNQLRDDLSTLSDVMKPLFENFRDHLDEWLESNYSYVHKDKVKILPTVKKLSDSAALVQDANIGTGTTIKMIRNAETEEVLGTVEVPLFGDENAVNPAEIRGKKVPNGTKLKLSYDASSHNAKLEKEFVKVSGVNEPGIPVSGGGGNAEILAKIQGKIPIMPGAGSAGPIFKNAGKMMDDDAFNRTIQKMMGPVTANIPAAYRGYDSGDDEESAIMATAQRLQTYKR
jgi:Zn-finger nucleic acid-binding protein